MNVSQSGATWWGGDVKGKTENLCRNPVTLAVALLTGI